MHWKYAWKYMESVLMSIRNLHRKWEYSMHEKNAHNRIYAYRIKNGVGVLFLQDNYVHLF